MSEPLAKIVMKFDRFSLDATLFDTKVGRSILGALPLTVSLTSWGSEVYGAIPGDHGEERPVPTIPAGGIAYSRHGSFFCIFFGQHPAWPVDYIGRIDNDAWMQLQGAHPTQVVISEKV